MFVPGLPNQDFKGSLLCGPWP